MRKSTLVIVMLLGGAALAGCDRESAASKATKEETILVAAPMATPERKPGLWRHTVASDGGAPQVIRICTDPATEKKVAWWGGGMAQGACVENTATRNADGSWTFKSVCKGGPSGDSTTEGTMTGDFNTRYEVKAKTTTMGSRVPEANGVHDVTFTAEWQGECPAGWLPGDTEVPGGQRINSLAFEQIKKEIEAQGLK